MHRRTAVTATLACIVAGLAGLAGTVGAAPAQARVNPPWEFVPSGLPFTFAAGQVCPFQVTLGEVENKEYSRDLGQGGTLIVGRLVVRVTNDATGASVVRDVSGPVKITTGPQGQSVFTLLGTGISPVFAGLDGTGKVGVGLFVFTGRTTFTDQVLTQAQGPYENLCQTLA